MSTSLISFSGLAFDLPAQHAFFGLTLVFSFELFAHMRRSHVKAPLLKHTSFFVPCLVFFVQPQRPATMLLNESLQSSCQSLHTGWWICLCTS
jgi:hypothetical protein